MLKSYYPLIKSSQVPAQSSSQNATIYIFSRLTIVIMKLLLSNMFSSQIKLNVIDAEKKKGGRGKHRLQQTEAFFCCSSPRVCIPQTGDFINSKKWRNIFLSKISIINHIWPSLSSFPFTAKILCWICDIIFMTAVPQIGLQLNQGIKQKISCEDGLWALLLD